MDQSVIQIEGVLQQRDANQGVQFRFTSEGLEFKGLANEQVGFIDRNNIRFVLGGNNKRLLFIKADSLAEGQHLYFEASFENLKKLKSLKAYQDLIAPLLKEKRGGHLEALVALTCVVGSLVLVLVFRSEIFGSLVPLVPVSLEQKVAGAFFSEPTKTFNANQKRVYEQLHALTRELKWPPHQGVLPWTLHIKSDAEANAFATIGGHIFVNKGFILLVDSSEEYLGVVAHELMHVEKRHVLRSSFEALGLFTFLSLFFGDLTGIAAVALDQGQALMQLSYSRELEEEADHLAFDLLVYNGINPLGLSESLKKLQQEYEKEIQNHPQGELIKKANDIELLSTHPDILERIKKIEQRAASTEAGMKKNSYRKLDVDWALLQKEFKEVF